MGWCGRVRRVSDESNAVDGTQMTRAVFYVNRGLSQAGQGTFLAGLLLLAGGSGTAAAGLSSVFVAMMAAAVIFGLPAGALADRLGPARALFAGASGRMLVIATALVVPGDPINLALVAFAYSTVSQMFSPAEMALVQVVATGKQARAHTALVALQHAGQGSGLFVLAPVAFWLGGPTFMIGTALAVYVLVACTSLLLALRVPAGGAVASCRQAFSFMGPLQYFSRWSSAGYAGVLLAFGELAAKSLLIALPAYLSNDLKLGSPEQMVLLLPAGIGVLGGLAWAGRSLRVTFAPSVLRLTLLGSVVSVVALAGLGDLIAGLAHMSDQGLVSFLASPERLSTFVVVPVGLLLGTCFAVTPIAGRAILSATAPAGQHGRVFAMQGMFTDMLCVAPLALSGLSTEVAGARTTFLAVGIVGLALFAILELTHLGHVRHMAPAPVRIKD